MTDPTNIEISCAPRGCLVALLAFPVVLLVFMAVAAIAEALI